MKRHTRCYIEEGKIIPPTGMELIIADHCNITCRQCNHISPVMPKWNVDPADVSRDLAMLARIYRPAYLKMIGGEPLLHPYLVEVIKAARSSNITDHYLLVTNGMLLDRMPEQAWSLIDEIEISRYHEAALSGDSLERARQLASRHAVKFTLNDYPEFRRTFTRRVNRDAVLVDKIFRACKMANVWGCHALYKGRIYRCPQSIYIPSLSKDRYSEGLPLAATVAFREELLAFLNSSQPLASCRYCVGTAGRKQAHRTLPRMDWLSDLDEPVEEMLDWPLLEQLLAEIMPLDDCKTPVRSGAEKAFHLTTGLQRLAQSMADSWRRR